jgi:hypothetical protein
MSKEFEYLQNLMRGDVTNEANDVKWIRNDGRCDGDVEWADITFTFATLAEVQENFHVHTYI